MSYGVVLNLDNFNIAFEILCMYTKLNELRKRVLRVRTDAHFTLAVLGIVARVTAIANLFSEEICLSISSKIEFIVRSTLLRNKIGIPARDNLKFKQNYIVIFTPSTGVLVCNKICELH